MADGYQLTGRIIPRRAGIAALGHPGEEVRWSFNAVSDLLGAAEPDPRFMKVLHVAKERFLKPARMTPGAFVVTNALVALLAAAAAAGGWLLLTPHGTGLYIAGLAALAALAVYVASDKTMVKPVAVVLFDIVTPAVLALPLVLVAVLQLAAGRFWRALGSIERVGGATAARQPANPD